MGASDLRAVPFVDALNRGGMVFDGAMGTALYERGILYTQSFDNACLTQPELVKQVHESYLRAGADVLSSNSFGANRHRLAQHGLQADVERINRAAVRLAREVAGDGAYVGASVGPTGLTWKTLSAAERASVRHAYREQCSVLLDAGIDVLLLETFRQPAEIETALEVARELAGDKVPVVASVSFDPFGTMADGTGPEQTARLLQAAGAHAIGVNCADGPAGVYEMVSRMLGVGLPVVAQPNAGLPHRVDGRFAYMATPDYFQLYARRLYKIGVKGVGGCCGTTAEHIRKVGAAARMLGTGSHVDSGGGMRDEDAPRAVPAPGVIVVPREQKSELGRKLGEQRFVVSVEVNPPPGLSLEKSLEGAKLLRDAGVDVINVADGPRASA
jgi:homocysteine S-methyltransferase